MSSEFHTTTRWQHKHNFTHHNEQGEKSTKWVLLLTVVTMVAEIAAGTIYGSMALLADGWHMGTHAAAFMLTLFAYSYARKHANNPRFAFGTGKVSVLGGFTSAIALGLVALLMLIESGSRLLYPEDIHFDQAILVAIIGLTVNIASVFLLKDHQGHDHGHSHGHNHGHNHAHDHGDCHGHKDHNLRAAYFHVLADALTSLLAIGALLAGKYFGLNWLDPVMGIVGAVIISRWAWGLISQTSPVLLDAGVEAEFSRKLVERIEAEKDHKVTDIHVWPVSADHHAAMISLVSHSPHSTDYYHELLADFNRIDHLTIEVNQCADCNKAATPRANEGEQASHTEAGDHHHHHH
ncbi:CDF family Co(II)/Ni(II) efflux transporter DmeF [Shewanella chilikensis]|uniref:CDF family Co(II)/Ni(II) efflux transporter DmeF n=1 Tax=Shewanella chilikensis TaxID=558541 RepID=UPI001F1E00E7|nr:CDF family Co(II)/Ni(II) efflux transporter DmeF [Shewanella chilikensis]MCE9786869.1 CDF family Co(II)/Ni(II) efflux transporter DmeF [Shewanella chilikensis]